MKKKFRIFILVIIMLFSSFVSGSIGIKNVYADDTQITVNFHYTRDDGDYAKWAMWIWNEKVTGKGYDFEVRENEAVLTYTCDGSINSIGFLVKGKADWNKDVGEDRTLDISDMTQGTVDVYLKSGVKEFTADKNPNAVPETTTEETTTAAIQATNVTKSSDSDKDSGGELSKIAILFADVIGLAVVAGVCYKVIGKKGKKK